MLTWAVRFLMIALVAGLLGYLGVAGTASSAVKMVFVICVGLCLAFLAMTALAVSFRRKPAKGEETQAGMPSASGVHEQ